MKINKYRLQIITAYIDSLPLECDGCTRLVHLALSRFEIPHLCMWGAMIRGETVVYPHLWVTVGTQMIIDYRITRYFPHACNGVFRRKDNRDIVYKGEVIALDLRISEVLENVTMVNQ